MKENPIIDVTLLGANVPCVRQIKKIKDSSNLRSVVQPGFEAHCNPMERVIAAEYGDRSFEILSDPEGIIRDIKAVGATTLEVYVLVDPSPEDIRYYKAILPIVPGRSMSFTPGKAIRLALSLDGEMLDRLVADYQAAVGEGAKLATVLHFIFGKKFASLRTITNGIRKFVMAKETNKTEAVTVKPETPKLTVIPGKQLPKRQTDVPAQKKTTGQDTTESEEEQYELDLFM